MKIYKLISLVCFMIVTNLAFGQKNLTIWVGGTCGMCQERIENAAMQLQGVKKASWDLNTNLLTLKITSDFYEDDLHTHLNSVGHDTEVSKATDEVYENLHGCCKYRDENDTAEVSDSNAKLYGDQTVYLWVDGICGMCQDRIEEAAMQLQGVNQVFWNVETKMISIDADENFNEGDFHTHMNSIGHDTKVSKASDEVYDNIHACCKYRDDAIVQAHLPTPDEKDSKYKRLYGDETVYLWVNGTCGMCKERIEKAAMQLQGINQVFWNVETKMISIDADENFYEGDFHTHMNSIGHDTKISKASDEIYENLHGCCKYRDEELPQGNIADEKKAIVKSELEIYLNSNAELHNQHEHDKMAFGMIYEQLNSGEVQPVIGANVYWLGSTDGTSTDVDGFFEMDKSDNSKSLVISYVGYKNDTIDMTGQNSVQLLLKSNFILDEVSIEYKKKTTEISFLNTLKVQNISEKELCKAACCNLSESFETNPSVDVSFTDAVTGTRKIEMLGLAGPYVQVMRENMPYIRGLAALYGFSYTPGTWIESMQLNMGAASVVNGPEAMTGQINVEIKKPGESERLYVNGFFNEAQRAELNINGSEKVSKNWTTAYLLHGNKQSLQRDRNNDGFIDLPMNEQFIAMNRWKYSNPNGIQTQFGIKGTYINKTSGQLFNTDQPLPEKLWQAKVRTERLEGWMKIGKVSSTNPNNSLGFQLNAVHHNQDANFGNQRYDALHQSAYANLIYQTILKSTDHKLRTGASLQLDNYNEQVLGQEFLRQEYLPGVFGEYHYAGNDKFSFIAGLRADYHNNFGLFFTPRIHAKYSPNETTAWRFVLGRGQRTASIFAENVGIFASNRAVLIDNVDNGNPYGLDQEIAWNTGANFTKEIILNKRSLVIALDYYYTQFTNQIIFDYDINPQEVHVYNLEGQSYSHSVQAQMDYEMFAGVDVRVAYRFNDVKVDQRDGLIQKALTSRHRAFINIGWEITKTWTWDATVNFQGSKRIPTTEENPIEYQIADSSPAFTTVNMHLSKAFNKRVEAYLGAENLFNFRQENAIISFDDVSSPYFDSSLVWGPINGRNLYVGFRYKL